MDVPTDTQMARLTWALLRRAQVGIDEIPQVNAIMAWLKKFERPPVPPELPPAPPPDGDATITPDPPKE